MLKNYKQSMQVKASAIWDPVWQYMMFIVMDRRIACFVFFT